MNQKQIASNYKIGVLVSGILFFLVIMLGVIFPEFMNYLTARPLRLFGWGLIGGGVCSFFKKEGYSMKPSLKKSMLVASNPFWVFGISKSSFRRHSGWKFQIWSVIVVGIGILMVL